MYGKEFLIPVNDLIVRDPVTKKPLPKKGAMKPTRGPLGRYWNRRIRDGSVIVGKSVVKKQPVQPVIQRSRKTNEKEEE